MRVLDRRAVVEGRGVEAVALHTLNHGFVTVLFESLAHLGTKAHKIHRLAILGAANRALYIAKRV